MKSSIAYYKGVLVRFSALLVLLMALRWVFFLFNQSLYSPLTFSDILNVFYGGFRFDLSILLYTNSLLLLIDLFPFSLLNQKGVRCAYRILFVAINSFLLSLICADIAFYPFNGKRIDTELLGLLGAIPALMASFFADYWYVFILFGALVYGLIVLSRVGYSTPSLPNIWIRLAAFALGVGCIVVGMRGGISNKRPLSIAAASKHVSADKISLVTNSAFTFLYSLVHRDIEIPAYFEDVELENVFPVEKNFGGDSISTKPNIVLLIMESFSKSYVGSFSGNSTYTPFLDSLTTKGTMCINGFADGRRSSQALVALTSGIPALLPEPFMYSNMAGNRVQGIPEQLKQIGYQSAFFNGSSKDKLGWEEFITQVGFDQYISKENYPNPGHSDGEWGIYDHYMFDHLLHVLDTSVRPSFYTLFSISSHHPFNIPDSVKEMFPSEGYLYWSALRYADWSLGQFFKKAEKKDWFKNTVFIVVADHTLNGESFTDDSHKKARTWYENRVGLYAIPILFYTPLDSTPKIVKAPFSQVDVSATILDLAGYEGKSITWGKSLKSLPEEKYCFQFVNGLYQINDDQFVVLFDGESSLGIFNYKTDFTFEIDLRNQPETKVLHDKMLMSLQGVIQQHHKRMVQNRLFIQKAQP
ncbi:MAG: sulfatase-like hydrolase/transferase [Flavobacteriales bacterium]|nr:sulfatase-like hydrolase/transferase [Flavobacteriales bacterium]